MALERSEVYLWLRSISSDLNLERLASEFERRGFRSKHSLKYLEKNDLEVIINSPDKLLLAEKRIIEKELEELKKPNLEPKELFQSTSNSSVINNNNGSLIQMAVTTPDPVPLVLNSAEKSAGSTNLRMTESSSYLEKKGQVWLRTCQFWEHKSQARKSS